MEDFEKDVVCELIMIDKICLDGCKLDEICYLLLEVSILLCVYGFGLFIWG